MSDQYEYSEDLNEELNENYNIDPSVLSQEDLVSTSEKYLKLLLYIRNYDSNGNLVSNPYDAIKTCIDTYEKEFTEYIWEAYEQDLDENENVIYNKKKYKKIVVENDPSFYITDEMKTIIPINIDQTTYLSEAIKNYFNSFQKSNTTQNTGKTCFIQFNNTSTKYEFYTLDDNFLGFLSSCGFSSIGINLDNKDIIFNDPTILECTALSIENVNLYLKRDISINSKSVYFENIKIYADKPNNKLLSISMTIKESCEISYITFDNNICTFEIGSIEKDMIKWMKTRVDIFNFIYENTQSELSGMYPIIKIKNIKEVSINSFFVECKRASNNLIVINNCIKVGFNSITFKAAERFEKTMVILNKIQELSVSRVKAIQGITKNLKKIYIFTISNGTMYSYYSFISLISRYIGLCKFINEYASRISFNSCSNLDGPDSFEFVNSSINKLIINETNISKINSLALSGVNISIFNSSFSDISKFDFKIKGKLFIETSTLKSENCDIYLLDDSSILLQKSTLKIKNLLIQGDNGSGRFSSDSSQIISDVVNLLYLKRISTMNTNYTAKEVSIKSESITHFSPIFIKNSLNEISITGKINNSNIVIDNNDIRSIKFNLINLKGNLGVKYNNKVYKDLYYISNSIVALSIEAEKNIENTKLSLEVVGECIGSLLTTNVENLNFTPKASGSFNSLKKFTKNDISSLNSYKWKKYIVYGVLP